MKPTTFPLVSLLILLAFSTSLPAQVDQVGSRTFRMSVNGNTLKIPYYSNLDLGTVDMEIAHAVLVVHGANRNADVYFANMTTAASRRPSDSDSTLIVAPQFLTETDINAFSLDGEHLYWSSGGWKSGSNSRDEVNNPRPERIPSYAVLDSLVLHLAQTYPNLRTLVFTGHSAGAQVANRYSASSPMVDILFQQFQICTKFIVANPSSYLYLDEKRRKAGTLDQFELPLNGCADYNEWKYGLEDLFTYPSRVGVDSIRNMLARREVVYLLGENDNDPNSSSLDTSCEADLQGNHRLERGTIYVNYLRDYYGNDINDFQSMDTVPNAGHSNFDMYTSNIGLFHLFESTPLFCSNNTTPIFPLEPAFEMTLYPNPVHQSLQIEAPWGEANIRVLGITGNVVREIGQIMGPKYVMNTKDLPQGTYVLEYQLGREYVRKVFLKH